MKLLISLFAIFIFVMTLLPVSASAQMGDCQPSYGAGQNCPPLQDMTIDLKVRNPQTDQFVDHLGANDPKYTTDDLIDYQITVKNTGRENKNTIVLRDFFPTGITFFSGPGQFDAATNTLTFVSREIRAGETQTYQLTARAVPEKLPTGNITCDPALTTNKVRVSIGDNSKEDASRICVQQGIGTQQIPGQTKGGLKVFEAPQTQATPKTGPELVLLAGLLPSGLFGYILRKKSGYK